MHDGVTQIVIGALLETEAARQALFDSVDRAAENLTRAKQLLAQAENEIRRVIYDLHPPVLDTMGLVVALKRFSVTYTATFGIECRVRVVDEPRRLPKEAEIAIYRIVQAALHNVATHAKAEEAWVGFEFGPEQFCVVIKDDGVGFDPGTIMAAPGEHLGLIGMKERAESLGANIDIVSESGAGTQIILKLKSPLYVDGAVA
jgi:two-component system sensor histidine kinase DegS